MSKKEQATVKIELTVGDLSKRSGVSVSALHFYESKGLIPAFRTEGNQRRYPRGVLRRVALIKVAQKLGVSLKEIAKVFETFPKGKSPSSKDWEVLSNKWRKDLDERIRALTKLRDELTGCIGCGCLSMKDCPLRNPEDECKKEGVGAYFLES